MARTVRNSKLDTRSARARLKQRREPYWVVLSKGCALGYRKGARGFWIARYRDEAGKQHYEALGAADDALDENAGAGCLSYKSAQERAGKWFERAERGFDGEEAAKGKVETVADALDAYLAEYQHRGGKALAQAKAAIDAHIRPALGSIRLSKLSEGRIKAWLKALAKAPRRLRAAKGSVPRYAAWDDTPEAQRRRQSTANRVLTFLKAALNQAVKNKHIASDDAWRLVEPFGEADAARVRYLNDEESRRLVNACELDFRSIVQAALLTGGRYGELIALRASDFNPDSGTVHIPKSKSGKSRHIVLTDEGRLFFESMTAGKAGDALIFTKADGTAWAKSHQQRPLGAALLRAKIEPLTFHELRHTYASRLVMRGVPLVVIAAQMGHAGTRMAEKHYAHLAQSYIADTVRAAFGPMGIVEPSNVTTLSRPKAK
ncbi:MAG: site-specific integrase [Rhodospirillales bacterium]|nr:site-specific integrase [Rhodospirillales bacterium]